MIHLVLLKINLSHSKLYVMIRQHEPEYPIVSSEAVTHPVAVRYAWGNNPDAANLYNNEGLPAAPFRTDNRPGITQPK